MFGATPLNIKLHNLSSIQAVQNLAASIVSNTRKYDHISPVFKEPVRMKEKNVRLVAHQFIIF